MMNNTAAGEAPVDQGVGRLEPERASACGLTECAGKPMCPRCVRWKARDDGMPGDRDERHLRRLLAVRVAMPNTYYDDGEAQGQEHGIVIDFMREPVADIDAKLCALNVARAIVAEGKTPNVGAKLPHAERPAPERGNACRVGST